MLEPTPGRVAIYTHDTFGMGHIRRCLNIIDALARAAPDTAILLITGSPAVHLLKDRPPNLDVVKLPTIAPTGAAEDRPPHLPLPTRKVIAMRSAMISACLESYRPDVFLVDNFALGARKELWEPLRALPRRTRVMLGLRDIVDAPEKIRESWPRDGVTEMLREVYDDILVFGDQQIFDAAAAYDLTRKIAAKIRYCGYVARASAPADDNALQDLGLTAPFLAVTVGGGGDGAPLLEAAVAALPDLPDLPVLLVTGPLMGEQARAETLARAKGQRVVIRDYLPNLVPVMARAEAVLCMGGYNTIGEVLRNGCRAVVAPRDWRFGEYRKGTSAGVEMEQILRAQALQEAGRVVTIAPGDLNGPAVAAALRDVMNRPRPDASTNGFDGAEVAARHILSHLPQWTKASA